MTPRARERKTVAENSDESQSVSVTSKEPGKTCVQCGSSDVALEVVDDPVVSDAYFCAQHIPANRR